MPEPTPQVPELRPVGAVVLVLVGFLAYLGVVLAGGLVAEGAGGVLFLVAAALVGPLVALYMGLNRYAPHLPTAEALRLGRPGGRGLAAAGLAIVVGAALAPLAADLSAWIVRLFPLEPLPPELAEELKGMGSSTFYSVLLVAQVAAAPFVEEAFFRGFLQPRLMATMGAPRGFGLTLLLCLVAQLNPRFMPAELTIAAAMGLTAAWSRTTWAAVAGHVAYEATPVVLEALGRPLPSYEEAAPRHLGVTAIALCLALAALAVAALWGLRRRD